MQIPVLNGVFTDEKSDFRVSYPRNLVPVAQGQGISSGYLRPADGVVALGAGPGAGRGGIEWNGVCYRVMGSQLVSVASDGAVTTLGAVGGSGRVTFDYSFDRLGIASDNKFFYWDGTTLTQVTDPDLGDVLDFIWIDGYFLTTDGTNLVVTELTDPTQVNPLKYGSSEVDPDPIFALLKIRDEAYVLNRYTTEVFRNVGGAGFPFQRIDGAQLQRGAVGTHAAAVFNDSVVFLGGAHNEGVSLWLGVNGQTVKLATREIDIILRGYGSATLADALIEVRVDSGHEWVMIHLPDQTLVYDASASSQLKAAVWFTLSSSVESGGQYRARGLVRCYDKWLVEDPQSTSIGYLSDSVSTHWGQRIGWEFSTAIVYNESRGAIFHQLELVTLAGRTEVGTNPLIRADYSLDGETWSQPRFIRAGTVGERLKRLVWLQQGSMRNWRIQRFAGDSDSRLSIARLEVQLEPLAF